MTNGYGKDRSSAVEILQISNCAIYWGHCFDIDSPQCTYWKEMEVGDQYNHI